MAKQDLIAAKGLRYSTRRLMPGEPFQASDRDARVLLAIKKAQPAPEKRADAAKESRALARAEYERVLGKRPFMGWDAAELQRRIAEHGA